MSFLDKIKLEIKKSKVIFLFSKTIYKVIVKKYFGHTLALRREAEKRAPISQCTHSFASIAN